MRTCNKCGQEQPLNCFASNGYGGLRPYCRGCAKVLWADYREKNRETLNAKQRERAAKDRPTQRSRTARSDLKRKYGITPEQKQQRLLEQGGKCALCFDFLLSNFSAKIDHSHETGKIRGILCSGCNTGLGHFRDSPEILQRAIEYLKRFQ